MKRANSAEVRITLGYWKPPTVWDRIKQDEPLDKPESEFVSAVTTNSEEQSLTVAVGAGAFENYTVTPILVDMGTDHTKLLLRHTMAGRVEDEPCFVYAKHPSRDVSGTHPVYQLADAPLAYSPGLSLNVEFLDNYSAQFPYPRNGKERKILETLVNRLPEVIEKAEKAIGPCDRSDKWNHKFFDYVSRKPPKNEAVSRRRAK